MMLAVGMGHEWDCRCIRCSFDWRHMALDPDDEQHDRESERREADKPGEAVHADR
jgi:hypothetical protein